MTIMVFLKHAGVAAVYGCLSWIVLRYSGYDGSIFYLASGFSLAVILIAGRSYVWAVAFGACACYLFRGDAVFLSLIRALGSALAAAVGAYLIQRDAKFDISRLTLNSLARIFIFGGVFSALIAAGLGSLSLHMEGVIPLSQVKTTFIRWWMGDVLGVLLLTPFILAWHGASSKKLQHKLEFGVIFTLATLMVGIVFLDWHFGLAFSWGLIIRPGWLYLLMLWPALRIGMRGTTSIFLYVVLLMWVGKTVSGNVDVTSNSYGWVNDWFYVISLGLLGMILAVYVEQIRRMAQKLLDFESAKRLEYEQTLSTIAQETQIESERYYAAILNSLSECVAILDRQGVILMTNVNWKNAIASNRMMGALEGDNYLVSCDVCSDMACAGRMKEGILSVLQDDKVPFSLEYCCRVGGLKNWFLCRVMSFSHNNPTRLIVTHKDITDKKLAEDLLHENETRLTYALEGSGDGMWDWDVINANVRYSLQWKALLGYADDELANEFSEWESRVHPDDLEKAQEDINACLNGVTVKYSNEHRLRCKSGNYKWILTRGMAWTRDESGRPTRMVGTHIDITHQKEIEVALRVAAATFETQECIIVLDRDLNIARVNTAFTQLFGYTKTDVVGQSVTMLNDDKQVDEKNHLMWQLALHDHHWQGEVWCKRADGVPVPTWQSITAVVDSDGIIFNYVLTLLNITRQKNDEVALLHSMKLLKEKDQSKTRFLAAAGHDLRQPLAAANMFIYALGSTQINTVQQDLLKSLKFSMVNFSGLLDTLLHVSKLDAGAITPELTVINVTELMIWLEQVFSIEVKDIGFKLYFPMNTPLFVHADLGLIKSVLSNLVANAIKFTPYGGILVSARLRGAGVLFQVWDTGIGIEDEKQNHVFDEFYQIDNPSRDRARGVGLGLSIVKRTLAVLGSQIKLSSRLGRGTVFSFRLPRVVMEEEGVGVSELVNTTSWVEGAQFVVLEDDALLSGATVQCLTLIGGTVRCFSRAEDALEDADITAADYYIVDHMLAGTMNGMAFLNQLQARTAKPIRAVLVTGDTSSEFIKQSAHFTWPIFYKPADLAELLASLL